MALVSGAFISGKSISGRFFTERLVDVKFQNTGAFNNKVIKRFINADHNWRFHSKTRRLPLKQFMNYKNMPTVIVVSR